MACSPRSQTKAAGGEGLLLSYLRGMARSGTHPITLVLLTDPALLTAGRWCTGFSIPRENPLSTGTVPARVVCGGVIVGGRPVGHLGPPSLWVWATDGGVPSARPWGAGTILRKRHVTSKPPRTAPPTPHPPSPPHPAPLPSDGSARSPVPWSCTKLSIGRGSRWKMCRGAGASQTCRCRSGRARCGGRSRTCPSHDGRRYPSASPTRLALSNSNSSSTSVRSSSSAWRSSGNGTPFGATSEEEKGRARVHSESTPQPPQLPVPWVRPVSSACHALLPCASRGCRLQAPTRSSSARRFRSRGE